MASTGLFRPQQEQADAHKVVFIIYSTPAKHVTYLRETRIPSYEPVSVGRDHEYQFGNQGNPATRMRQQGAKRK
jgi:hypothetical protein